MKTFKFNLKVIYFLLTILFLIVSIYQLCTIETTHDTPVGSYTCKGGIIKVCSGSNAVAEYLGI